MCYKLKLQFSAPRVDAVSAGVSLGVYPVQGAVPGAGSVVRAVLMVPLISCVAIRVATSLKVHQKIQSTLGFAIMGLAANLFIATTALLTDLRHYMILLGL